MCLLDHRKLANINSKKIVRTKTNGPKLTRPKATWAQAAPRQTQTGVLMPRHRVNPWWKGLSQRTGLGRSGWAWVPIGDGKWPSWFGLNQWQAKIPSRMAGWTNYDAIYMTDRHTSPMVIDDSFRALGDGRWLSQITIFLVVIMTQLYLYRHQTLSV